MTDRGVIAAQQLSVIEQLHAGVDDDAERRALNKVLGRLNAQMNALL